MYGNNFGGCNSSNNNIDNKKYDSNKICAKNIENNILNSFLKIEYLRLIFD